MDHNNQTVQNPVPAYFNLEPHKREEILSQVGSFTQVQYQIFHHICDFWETALEYNKYVLKTKQSALTGHNQLEHLMNKMQDAHMGLLQYKLSEEGLKPFRIVLTDKDAPLFYYYICEEILYRNIHESGHPFITVKSFEKYGLSLAGDLIVPLDPKTMSPGFHRKMALQTTILGIIRKNRSPILIPSGLLDEYITYLINHLIREFQSMTLLETISRLSNIKISELQKNVNNRDPAFWITLSKSLITYRDEIKIRSKGISPLVFTSAQILYSYFSNSLSELKEKQQEKMQRQNAQREIIEEIRGKETQWTLISQFDTLLKEKEAQWKGFREDFKEEVLKRKEGGEQPDLIILGGQIIHKDSLFPFFKKEMDRTKRELHLLYQDMMYDLLRNGQTDHYTQFYNKNNFRADIMNRIRNKTPQLKEMLQKPALVASSGFYFYKDLKGIKRNDTIRESLELYYKNDLKQFQNIDDILQLNLVALFDNAFKDMSWWNKFLLRITGKYDSLTSAFSDSPSSPSARPLSRKSKPQQKNKTISPSKYPPGTTSSSRRRPSPQEQKRMHSIREKKKAWAEFNDVVDRRK